MKNVLNMLQEGIDNLDNAMTSNPLLGRLTEAELDELEKEAEKLYA